MGATPIRHHQPPPPPILHTGFAPNETAGPAGYPTASDEASEKPRPMAKVAMSPSWKRDVCMSVSQSCDLTGMPDLGVNTRRRMTWTHTLGGHMGERFRSMLVIYLVVGCGG